MTGGLDATARPGLLGRAVLPERRRQVDPQFLLCGRSGLELD